MLYNAYFYFNTKFPEVTIYIATIIIISHSEI